MLKLLFIAAGGLSGIVGWASFSAPNWDPKNLWRITVNNKFYLSSCFNDPYDKKEKWTKSDLLIYLTPKKSVSVTGEDIELQLWGKGDSTKMKDNQVLSPASYHDKDLQNTLISDDNHHHQSSEFSLKQESYLSIGENVVGEDAEIFGMTIKCNDKVFDLTKTGVTGNGYRQLDLNKVTFKLTNDVGEVNNQLKDKYKDHEVYSIKIEVQGDTSTQLKWADSFEKPIVIIPST